MREWWSSYPLMLILKHAEICNLQVSAVKRVGSEPLEGVPDTAPRMVYLKMQDGSQQV